MDGASTESRVALITGATDGLGRGLAGELADAGWTVLVHGRSQARIDATVGELAEMAEDVRAYRADLSSLDEVRRLAAEIREVEMDFRTGKLSEADWKAIDRQLRAEAVDLLRELDRHHPQDEG